MKNLVASGWLLKFSGLVYEEIVVVVLVFEVLSRLEVHSCANVQ